MLNLVNDQVNITDPSRLQYNNNVVYPPEQNISNKGIDQKKYVERNELVSICFYCGKKLSKSAKPGLRPTRDHVQPICRGGQNVKENRVIACTTCNNDKAGLTLEEYRLVIALRKNLIKTTTKLKFVGEVSVAKEESKITSKAKELVARGMSRRTFIFFGKRK